MRVSDHFFVLVLVLTPSSTDAIHDAEAATIPHRQLRGISLGARFGHPGDNLNLQFNFHGDFDHDDAGFDKMKSAFAVLQAWKSSITADPTQATATWVGPDVCSYKGIFCHTPPDGPKVNVVAGIDLNGAGIAGCIPEELGQLTDLTLIHLNSNQFSGPIPASFKNLSLLFELDLSNNLFAGPFPKMLLDLPSLKFLDLRFNSFDGEIPKEVFDKNLDALFLNSNKFCKEIPPNFGNSNCSVIVLADNQLTGCIPPSIANMSKSLNQLNLANNGLTGPLPNELGQLHALTVLTLTNNSFTGPIPDCYKEMTCLEALDVSCNQLTGTVPDSVCGLPKLKNVSIESNYFDCLGKVCEAGASTKKLALNVSQNCLPGAPYQRDAGMCKAGPSKPVAAIKS